MGVSLNILLMIILFPDIPIKTAFAPGRGNSHPEEAPVADILPGSPGKNILFF